MRYRILKILFITWIILWAWFISRELFLKDKIEGYRVLLSRSFEGKHAYVTGDRLYEFVTFCKERLPEGAAYDARGAVEKHGLLGLNRVVYYMYPHLKKPGSDFMLVYEDGGTLQEGYEVHAKLDEGRYILKRV